MFKFYIFLLALLILVFSSPTLFPRDDCTTKHGMPGGVYYCPAPDFQPSTLTACQYKAGRESCIDIPAKDRKFSSIGLDPDTERWLYADPGCMGNIIIESGSDKSVDSH
jgi:hypothetical protein